VAVDFTFGTYDVAEPHLEGWHVMLGVLEPDDFAAVAELFQQTDALLEAARTDADKRTPEQEAIRQKAAKVILPLVGRVPRLAQAFVAACLRTVGDASGVVAMDAVKLATASDLNAFLAEALRVGAFQGLADLAKNAASLAPGAAETA